MNIRFEPLTHGYRRLLLSLLVASSVQAGPVPGPQPVPQITPAAPAVAPLPMRRDLLPLIVEQTDGPAAMTSIGWKAQGAFASGNFEQLDKLFESLTPTDQVTDDGRQRLAGVAEGLWDFLYNWKSWDRDLEKIAQWRKERPDSIGADFTEVILLRAWAWQARGEGYSSTVAPEGWALFRERLVRAQAVLDRSKHRASSSPMWYQLSLSVGRDLDRDKKSYQALFDEAKRKYPAYVNLYLSMSDFLSPKWGGSYLAVDRLARSTALAADGSRDYSMYSRIYWNLSEQQELTFDLFKDSLASWELMKLGFEQIASRYPNSVWNQNAFAAFACRASDGATYATLRIKLGNNVNSQAWPSNYSTDVCDRRLLRET